MIELKAGVRLDNLSPQIVLALMIADGVWEDQWDDLVGDPLRVALVVTSINDGKHSRTSLHNIGHACDLRTKTLASNAAKRWFAAEVKRRVGVEFDVILEKLGTVNEHLHVEYQPKR